MSNTLPATTAIASVTTQAAAKTLFENQRDFISNSLGGAPESLLTIAAGSITPPALDGGAQFSIATEASATADDLTNIAVTNMQDGQLLLLRPNSAAQTIVVKDTAGGSGQIFLEDNADFDMEDVDYSLMLRLRGTIWYEVSRSYGDTHRILQHVAVVSGGVATGSTVVPFDDTVPQSGEGDQFISQVFVPKDPDSNLLIEAVLHLSNDAGAQTMSAALFVDSSAPCIAAGYTYMPVASVAVGQVHIRVKVPAVIASTRTYKVRAGGNNAGKTTFNGIGAARRLGGLLKSSLTITEIR